jgi:hypothetical protein
MTITISEKDASVIDHILALLQRKKIPFKIENRFSEPSLNDENIVWDWEGCEHAEYKLSMSVFADDWNAPENDHWDNY